MKIKFILILAIVFNLACSQKKSQPLINPKSFDRLIDGKQVKIYTIKNANGLEMTVTNYGARIVSLLVPNKFREMDDIVFGYDSIDGYLNSSESYFGAAIGRYCNRINKGEFMLGDTQYQLSRNNGSNSLHGGKKGFSSKIWEMEQKSANELSFSLISPDMEEGYPGELKVQMAYTLTDDNELVIKYQANTNKSTIVNLTNHSYFNLHGAGNGTILDHILYLNSDSITPIDSTLIPTGKLMSVTGTPFDFKTPTLIGLRIGDQHQQVKYGLGYDINYVLNKSGGKKLDLAAAVYDPESGRVLEVFTDQPGIQLYSGNFLNGKYPGKKGKYYGYRSGFCLETQHFPDSPNHSTFPSTNLKPDQVYTHTCIYKFSVKR